jgi:dipeptidyl aminopeptidase/acylaminoacyl peptidase
MRLAFKRVAAWVLAAVLASGTTVAFGAPPPVTDFFRSPAIDEVSVSPNGKRLALLVFGPDGRRRLGVMDLVPPGPPRVIAGYTDADIQRVYWINDDRLYYTSYERDDWRASYRGYAIDHDGKRPIDMPGGALVGTVQDGGTEVLIRRTQWTSTGEVRSVLLYTVDTLTGRPRSISYGAPDGARSWLVDSKGEPRVVEAFEDGRSTIHWRGNRDEKWTKVADFDSLRESGIEPWAVGEGNQIFVTTRAAGDVQALYRFDPVARKLEDEPLVRVQGFDLMPIGEFQSGTDRLLGLHFTTDVLHSYWFDAGVRKVQNTIDAALPPDRRNRLYCGKCETTRHFVVFSSSDRQPGEYFLYDREAATLEKIGAARPWIDENTQGRRSFHRVKTRDGLEMPVYVTHPVGSVEGTPLPTVVLVHGGPYMRGSSLRWDAEAQFLASRGYRVLQPEFRGTEGYGFKHFQAGWKQWGGRMQDDLVDAVQWASREKLADASRVCVVGASYGGYAALMGPIAHPGAYRCAASFAGVTDIGLMYSIIHSDISDVSRRYGMPLMIGDPDKDEELLKRWSPLRRAAEIKVPLLVGHGRRDRRVPIKHSRDFISAARDAGVPVEDVEYHNEGHGLYLLPNATDYYGRLEKLLARSLATQP